MTKINFGSKGFSQRNPFSQREEQPANHEEEKQEKEQESIFSRKDKFSRNLNRTGCITTIQNLFDDRINGAIREKEKYEKQIKLIKNELHQENKRSGQGNKLDYYS